MPDFSKRVCGEESDERETPPELFNVVNHLLGYPFFLDVCATKENRKLPRFYSKEGTGGDGLTLPWHDEFTGCSWFWCNPPYSDIKSWVFKCGYEVQEHHARGVMLVPAAPETVWWRYLMKVALEVAFLTPRVKFLQEGKQMGSPPFASALITVGPSLTTGSPIFGTLDWREYAKVFSSVPGEAAELPSSRDPEYDEGRVLTVHPGGDSLVGGAGLEATE